MRLGLADYSGLEPAVVDALKEHETQINAGWEQEHHTDGTHKIVTADGAQFAAQAIPTSGVLTMPQLTANRDNYVIPNLAAFLVIKMSTDAARNITGIVAPTDRTVMPRVLLHNIGGFNAVLVHDSANSFATNRFYGPGAANVTLNQYDSIWIHYDWTLFRWVIEGI